MNKQKEQTVGEVLAQVPNYLFGYVLGFVLAIVSDITITSLFLGSSALAYATNIWYGLAAFFLLHFLVRLTNALSSAIVQNGRLGAQGTALVAQTLAPQDNGSTH